MFDLLLVLLQNSGKVLRKDFLLQSVWPDSFVEEGNITFNIRQLRKALHDDAQSPTYIETVQRRGYRFMLPVDSFTTETPDRAEEVSEDTAPTESDTPVQRSHRYLFIGMSAFVVIGALAIGGWLLKNGNVGSAPILSAPFKLEKLSTDGGVFHIVISPDGKNVVYTHRTGGKQSLWLRQLENSNNVPIVPPSDDFYGGLAISPDGNTVYFVRGSQLGPQLTIYRMPIFGGVPQKITEGTQGWISLSGDGRKISYLRCPYSDEDYCSLYVADAADGQNEKKLVTRPRPIRIGDNELSPDGKTVAFAVGQSRTSSNEFTFSAVDVETGAERLLTPEKFFNISYIAWLPDQSGLLITAMQLPGRSYRICHVAQPDGAITNFTSDSETYSRLSLDAKGSLLVSTQVEPDFQLVLFQSENPTAPPRVLGDALSVAFAPDGKLYFSTQRTGDAEIWSVNADGSDLRQLTNNPAADVVPMVSQDSKTVFFQSDRSGTTQLWRMNADGSNQRQLTADEGGVPIRVSPDGAWLYYRSALKNTLRRVGIETAKEEFVLKETGRSIVISPDLTHVAYSQRSGSENILTIASLPDGEVVKTWRVAGLPNVAHLSWSDDGQYLAYVLTDGARELGGLWFQPINEESPKHIADLSGDVIAELHAFALSNDGKSFAAIKGNWKHDAVLLRGL